MRIGITIATVEPHFLRPPGETVFGSRNEGVQGKNLERNISKRNKNWLEKSGEKLERSISKGNEKWFEKLEVLQNRRSEKSRFHSVIIPFLLRDSKVDCTM